MQAVSCELKAEVVARLRRIEGQVRGVQRMIEEERDCDEILHQMAAVRSAMRHASLELARGYLNGSLRDLGYDGANQLADHLVGVIGSCE
jgi:DNA-binding FrmR family transcriptional regulator